MLNYPKYNVNKKFIDELIRFIILKNFTDIKRSEIDDRKQMVIEIGPIRIHSIKGRLGEEYELDYDWSTKLCFSLSVRRPQSSQDILIYSTSIVFYGNAVKKLRNHTEIPNYGDVFLKDDLKNFIDKIKYKIGKEEFKYEIPEWIKDEIHAAYQNLLASLDDTIEKNNTQLFLNNPDEVKAEQFRLQKEVCVLLSRVLKDLFEEYGGDVPVISFQAKKNAIDILSDVIFPALGLKLKKADVEDIVNKYYADLMVEAIPSESREIYLMKALKKLERGDGTSVRN